MDTRARWLVAVLASLGCFAGCWTGLAAERVLDTGSEVGIAAVPLTVALAVLGAWAERGRERSVDLVGVWADDPNMFLGVVSAWVNVNNSAELPIMIEEVILQICAKWNPHYWKSNSEVSEDNLHMTPPLRVTISDIGHIGPQTTWRKKYEIDAKNTKLIPDKQNSLYALWCLVERFIVVDDAGHKWQVHPNRKDRTRRVNREFCRSRAHL